MTIRLPILRPILIALMVVPIFLNVGPGHLGLGASPRAALRSATTGVDLSLGVVVFVPTVVMGALLGVVHLDLRGNLTLRRLAFIGFAVVNVIAFLVGAMTQPMFNTPVSTGFLLQTLLPMTAYVFARSLRRGDSQELQSVLDLMVFILFLAAIVILAQTALSGLDAKTGISPRFGPFNNSKALRFFPSMIAVGFVLTFARRLAIQRPGFVLTAAPMAFGSILILSHSRTALATAFGGTVLVLMIIKKRSRILFSMGLLLIVATAVLSSGVVDSANGSSSSATTAWQRFTVTDAEIDHGDALRWQAIQDSLAITVTRPLGRQYNANLESSTAGQDVAIARIAISENQVGEFGVRAGMGAVALFAILAFDSLRGQAAKIQQSKLEKDHIAIHREAGIFGALAAVVLGGSLLQLNFTESYFAIVAWFVLGLGGQTNPIGMATANNSIDLTSRRHSNDELLRLRTQDSLVADPR